MIRRTVFAALVAVAGLGVSEASAQTIGFKLGASFANWDVDDDAGTVEGDRLTAFMGGGFIRFGFGRLGIQPELLVVTRGTQFNDPNSDDNIKAKVDYVEVPVLLVLPLTMGTGISPYVFGGPSFAFEIACNAELEVGGNSVEGECDEDDVGSRKSMDFGVTGGAGLAFPVGPGDLFVEGRYNWGLTNLNDDDTDPATVKSRTAAVLAGYSIWLGRR